MENGPILLTGATGLLGHWLTRSSPADVALVALAHRRPITSIPSLSADLRDPIGTRQAIKTVQPKLVLHAAYAKDRASNIDATKNVVEAARSSNAIVMFVSSDAVFQGDGVRRDESSTPDPSWDYGRWKAEAEEAVVSGSPANVVIRLPLMVSVEPEDHMVRRIREGSSSGSRTQWYVDEVRQPALASEVAAAIWQIAQLQEQERAGYWHLAGPESLSRFEIARRLVDSLGLPEAAIQATRQPSDSGRPMNIVLGDSRARTHIAWHPSAIL